MPPVTHCQIGAIQRDSRHSRDGERPADAQTVNPEAVRRDRNAGGRSQSLLAEDAVETPPSAAET